MTHHDHPTDATLLDRFVRRREEAAFAALVRRHGPVVRAVGRRVLANEHDVEDVAQATFLVLARRAADVEPGSSVRGWLCGVARRLALHSRAGAFRRARREVPVAAWLESDPTAAPEPYSEQLDPLAEVARRELCGVVGQEVSRLPERYREPVVLCDMEGLTHAEAARRLGLPSGSMSRRLGRARALLRRRLVGRGLPVAIALVFALVLGGLAAVDRSLERSRVTAVRAAMIPFRGGWGDDSGFSALFARGHDLDPPAARHLAGASLRLAREVRTLGRAGARVEWSGYVDALDDAAAGLAAAARGADPAATAAAARRLEASCRACHLAFRL